MFISYIFIDRCLLLYQQMRIYVQGMTPYLLVIRSKIYRGYVKLRIIPNAIYNVIFV
jgi:hypothetical protein